MEKTGSIDSFLTQLSKTQERSIFAEKTSAILAERNEMKKLVKELQAIGQTYDLQTILGVERAFLRSEFERHKNDKVKMLETSIESAVVDLDKADKLIYIVQDAKQYAIVNLGVSEQKHDRQDKLPKDAFHRFVDSHKTRLNNRIKAAELSFEERLLIKERVNNMNICKQEYMKFQSNVLNISLPTKSKEHER